MLRLIKFLPASGAEPEKMTWALALKRYPRLAQYEETLQQGIAVFAEEGIFERTEMGE